jgi:hypothetical protein
MTAREASQSRTAQREEAAYPPPQWAPAPKGVGPA